MSKALRSYNIPANLPVGEKLHDHQVVNNTGGFVYSVSDKTRLERFLILGTDGGTYYVTEQDLTKQNVRWLQELIRRDSALVLDTVLDVSVSGRAYRNSAALFTLALVLNHGDVESKARAVSFAPLIARTATHLFELAQYIENLGGWGRAKRRAVAGWFTEKTPDQLAYQAVKYRQRSGWTLKDTMRLSHPVGVDQRVGNFILGKETAYRSGIIEGFQAIQAETTVRGVLNILDTFPNLPWETIPTQFLKDPEVWKKLFYNGQLKGQALVRNVTRLSKINAFNDLSFTGDYALALQDKGMIAKTRLHPIQYLMAQVTYSEGQATKSNGFYGDVVRNKTWNANPKILSALQNGFYESFATVIPSNTRTMIGVDVSGSMSWASAIGSDLTAAQGAAAMAMVTTRVEPYTEVFGFASTLRDLGISPSMSFSEIMSKTSINNFGYTDASLLMNHAKSNQIKVDTFIVITDNEVNHGGHPSQALNNYRQAMGINARLVVMGMTATDFTIADPTDRGMLDVCGFDSNTPKVVADFSAGRF